MSDSDESAPPSSRVRAWARQFHDDENELMDGVGRNFEYLLDHVDEWENGDFSFRDLPALEPDDRWLICACAGFGSCWACSDSTVFVVSDSDDRFIGLYGHESHAEERSDEEDGVTVREVEVNGADPADQVERFQAADGEPQQVLGDIFEFLLDNRDEFEDGDLSPDEIPTVEKNTKWLIAYSVLFGMLWELSHPSLYGVFTSDQEFVDMYWTPDEAEAAAEPHDDYYVQRVSVADGDLPPEEIIGDPDIDP